MTVLVAWAPVADAAALATDTAWQLTGRHPGPLLRLCPHCGSTEHGAPTFADGPAVSIAHAAGISIVAVSLAGPVGVDIEPAGTDQAWVRREAVGKAHGVGVLSDPPTDGAWVEDLSLEGYLGAVAVLATDRPEVRAAAAARDPAAMR